MADDTLNVKGGSEALADGFQLLIDALKLNDLNTIYGVPGIPVTDLGRMAQDSGIRILSFRSEQNAGNAIAASVETGHPVLAIEGDSAFGFSGMEIETICRFALLSSTTMEFTVARM